MATFLILLLFAVVFLVAGGTLLYFRCKTQQKSSLMGETQTSNDTDVSGLSPGTLVEVKGKLRCDSPLTGEMAGESCAYYSATVSSEYLERDNGDGGPGSDRRTEVLSQVERFAPFSVEDSSGRVQVDAEGAG